MGVRVCQQIKAIARASCLFLYYYYYTITMSVTINSGTDKLLLQQLSLPSYSVDSYCYPQQNK